jgi:hypothetical protein
MGSPSSPPVFSCPISQRPAGAEGADRRMVRSKGSSAVKRLENLLEGLGMFDLRRNGSIWPQDFSARPLDRELLQVEQPLDEQPNGICVEDGRYGSSKHEEDDLAQPRASPLRGLQARQ